MNYRIVIDRLIILIGTGIQLQLKNSGGLIVYLHAYGEFSAVITFTERAVLYDVAVVEYCGRVAVEGVIYVSCSVVAYSCFDSVRAVGRKRSDEGGVASLSGAAY